MKENMAKIRRIPWARRLVLFAAALLAAAGMAATPSVEGVSSEAILDHLNAVIDWYRNTQTNVPNVGLPSDTMYEFYARSMAAEVAQLAFDSASADAALVPPAPTSAAATGQSTAQTSLVKTENDVAARIRVLQAQISALNQQIAGARKAKLQQLTEERDRAQGELDLRNAMHDALGQIVKFSANGENGQSGLEGSINELRSSVPELATTGAPKTTAKTSSTVTGATPAANGLIGEVVALYDQLQALNQVSQLMAQTARVRDAAMKLRSPLLATLKATIQQGEQMAATNNSAPPTPAGTGAKNTAQPDTQRQQFDVLAARFKQISAATLPLSQEILVLDQANSNFLEWRQALIHESDRILRTVVLRVLAIALAIGVILLLSEIWRRITFRYISDIRRRRQFLMLRRIVIGFCMGIVFILGFVSEFSSLATFAGFITAGLAVGLQTILLSVAAYFFLVGRWGIRVGDRITVAGVTGDVVDVGLVRLYLMELAGTGVDLHPTGRIVVLSNAVLFQATTPLFKQLPGAEYTWHEVAVGLNKGGNYGLVEHQILDAVHSMHSPYGEELQRQLGQTERRIDIQMTVPKAHGQLQYTDTGLEYVVRYPVGLRQVSEVDEKITRKLLDLLEQQPELQASVSGFPRIRAAVKG
jgi:small-conductance mechanosensitive channel